MPFTTFHRSLALGAVMLVAVAAPADAIDGVTLITQSRAIAGGVTQGDAPGFPVTISRAGSYRLASNLSPGAANAIEIVTDNVTLDLNGFAIQGTSQGVGSGVSASEDRRNITVMNGSVRDMGGSGIVLLGRAHRVDGVRVIGNRVAGISAGGLSMVTNSMAVENLLDGIVVGLDGGGTVTGNTTAGNLRFGISVGAGTTVAGNTARENGVGIRVICPSAVIGNTVIQNEDRNILLVGAGCTLAHNATP